MFKILLVLLHRFRKETRALSSAGSEHLPYKQRVGSDIFTAKKRWKIWMFKILLVLLHRFRKETRALSSAGSEHLPYKQRVGGSNPSAPTPIPFQFNIMKHGRLAQLVQSICLTSRGSAVRIRQRPLLVLHDTSKQTHTKGRLAQLVQSICLTSRGSAVRIRQRPPHSSEQLSE